jgi:hypothetical protein
MSWLGFSFLLLFLLFPPNSFAQAHLWKYTPFRASDTGHSGGDQICDLRRDSDGDGKPDRLGDYVTVSGTVIAEPSTYETGGWLFWIRGAGCGILVYGEQETLALGDSISVCGWLRCTNGNYFFPRTGMATLGDMAIENGGIALRGRSPNHHCIKVCPTEYSRHPDVYAGNLISLAGLSPIGGTVDPDGNAFMWFGTGCDSVLVYLDSDTGCSMDCDAGGCYSLTGVVTCMRIPPGFASSPSWCVAPRSMDDIVPGHSCTWISQTTWGILKAGFAHHD